MTDDLDTRLRARLHALAEAVPVEPSPGHGSALAPVRAGPVRLRHRSTPVGGVLVALVAVVALLAASSWFARHGPAGEPSPSPQESSAAPVVVSCGLPRASDCASALPATLRAVRGVGPPPARVTFADWMLCSNPLFLAGPIAGLCVANPPAGATVRLGHAVVTFEGVSWRAYLNIWGGPDGVAADLIAVRTEPAYWDHAADLSPSPTGTSAASPPPSAPSSMPAAVTDRAALPSCGVERATTQEGPRNEAARACFWGAYLTSRPAEFVSTQLSVEGDPITWIYRVLGPGRIEIFIDSSQDRFAADRGWQRLDCTTLFTWPSATSTPEFGPDGTCVETPVR